MTVWQCRAIKAKTAFSKTNTDQRRSKMNVCEGDGFKKYWWLKEDDSIRLWNLRGWSAISIFPLSLSFSPTLPPHCLSCSLTFFYPFYPLLRDIPKKEFHCCLSLLSAHERVWFLRIKEEFFTTICFCTLTFFMSQMIFSRPIRMNNLINWSFIL